MTIVNDAIDVINRCPEYIGKGILQLLILTVGGVIVAWITTRVFGRKSEINAVEGTLWKRKMDIYEELSGKLEALKAAVIIPSDIHAAAAESLRDVGLAFNSVNSNQILSIFDSPKNLTDAFLGIDKYISSKKLYYDHDVMIQTMRFQNYFAVFRRFLVMFEEQFINKGIALDENEVVAAERLLTVEMGLVLQEELMEQADKVIATIKQSFIHIDFKHRNQIAYSYDFFNNPEGPIMSELINTRLMQQRNELLAIVTNAVALGMAKNMMSGKSN